MSAPSNGLAHPAAAAVKNAKTRVETYDWLRGLASLAVVLGHLKPAPKLYFVWSVNLFVIVTLALISRSKFTWEKLARRFFYLAFVYLVTMAVFHAVRSFQGTALPLSQVFLNPRSVFVQNPYLGDVWYIGLYPQILLVYFAAQNALKKWQPATVLAVTLFVSQAMFYLTHFQLHKLHSILVIGWVFVMAIGYYFAPRAVEAIQRGNAGRAARTLALLGTLVFFYWSSRFLPWFEPNENRTFMLNTIVFCVVYWFLAEIFFLVERVRALGPLKRFVLDLSRFTLIMYLAHMAFAQLVKPLELHPAVWTLYTVAVTFLYAKLLHGAYQKIDPYVFKKKENARAVQGVPPAAPGAAHTNGASPKPAYRGDGA